MKDANSRRKFGYARAPGKICRFLDPIENATSRPEGESSKGIAVRKHPYAMLRDMPEVQPVAVEMLDGVVGEQPLREDLDRDSHAEFELKNVWRQAISRRIRRELKRLAKKKGATGGNTRQRGTNPSRVRQNAGR